MRNFIEFGVKRSNTKKIYETLSGDLYDTYMLGRYFKDIYNLDKVVSKKILFNDKLLHDNKDLKFNLINFFLLIDNKKKKFFEFGFTLYEKIFYFKFFNKFSKKKLNIDKVTYAGNEISDQFIFFCQNFFKDYNLNLSKKVKKFFFQDSVFFAKGVTLLYEKKNMFYLKNFIKFCNSGSFDISLYPQKKTLLLETGYQLNYPSIEEFEDLIKNSKKNFFYRNKKKIGKKIYLEVLFGDKNLGNKINNHLSNFSKTKNKILKKHLSLHKKFHVLKLSCLK